VVKNDLKKFSLEKITKGVADKTKHIEQAYRM